MRKKYLGVITARGGSKGIPRKNIKELNGKPLIAYTIEACKQAMEDGFLDECIVSTDDEEIAEVAKAYGAKVPFLRPDWLASDTAKSVDAIIHALDEMEKLGTKYDAALTLQPTSPLRRAIDVEESIRIFDEHDEDSLIAVYEDIKANGFNYYRMDENGIGLAEHKEHNTGIRRQEMKPMYVRNGAMYISTPQLLRERKMIIGDKPLLYVMPKYYSTDIDTIEDFEYVEWLMKRGN